MNVSKYQIESTRTLHRNEPFSLTQAELMLVALALGLVGEAGELGNLVKKGILHGHGLNIDKLTEELGDVMWYIAGLCTTLDIDLNDVLENNIKKLERRYPQGFTQEDSIKRVDVTT